MKKPFTIAVLISGGGTTLRNLIAKKILGALAAEIRIVVSSKTDAGGLAYAMLAGIENVVFDYREYSTADAISEVVFAACRDAGVDLVVMGGFLRRVVIPEDFTNRVINIHPSLIPAFCGQGMHGLNVHRAVLKKGIPVTGCTVHFVDNQYDHGPIIAQESVAVMPGDTPEELAARVFETECELYPKVISSIARGEVSVVGDEVIVRR